MILLGLAVMAVLAYRDASRSETRYPPLGWAILTFFGGLFGVLTYLAVEKFYLGDELRLADGR